MIELTQVEINNFEETLCQSNFFESDRQLETLFMSKEISFLRNEIPEANTRMERVRRCLYYLLIQNDISLLVFFLEILRDRHPPSLFSNDLSNLIDISKQIIFTKNSWEIINKLNKNHDLSTTELVALAQSNLDANNYDETIKLCGKIFEEEFNDPIANIICSIALMRGNNVNKLSHETLKRIEGHLQKIIVEYPHTTLSWVVLGLVKHDYYILNKKSMGKPTIAEIKIHTRNSNLTLSDWALISKAKFSSRAFRMLALPINNDLTNSQAK